MTVETTSVQEVGLYEADGGVARQLVAVKVDGLWTVIDALAVPHTEEGDRDERIVESRLGGEAEAEALVADYLEQCAIRGGPLVRAS